MRAFDWCQNQRPRMTVNSYFALGFPPPVLFIQPRGSGFCDANPGVGWGTPGSGSGFAYRQNGSKTIGFQWYRSLTGYVQSDYLFL